eukprot:2930407-Pyramimonas_sp.AAC.1
MAWQRGGHAVKMKGCPKLRCGQGCKGAQGMDARVTTWMQGCKDAQGVDARMHRAWMLGGPEAETAR